MFEYEEMWKVYIMYSDVSVIVPFPEPVRGTCGRNRSSDQPPVPFLLPPCHHHPSLFPSITTSKPFSLLLYMPTCRRKRVVLTEPSDALLQAVRSDPHRPVFYLHQTGELFETYEYVDSTIPLPHFTSSRLLGPMLRACPFTA